MSITDSIVSSTVTRDTLFPSRAGFGTALFVAFHALWAPTVRSFSSLPAVKAAVVAGGGTLHHPIVRAATKYFGQNPRPKTLTIGKRSTFTQVVTLEVKKITVGYVYTFDVFNQSTGALTAINYTVLTGATTTTVATALAALIDAAADVVATSAVAVITATSTAGLLVGYRNLPPISDLLVKDTSTEAGLTADLDAILAATKLSKGLVTWYGIALDHSSEAEILTAAAWAEANFCVYVARTSDGGCSDTGVTTDVLSDLKAASYTRTGVLFAQYATDDFRDLAWMAKVLPEQPGTVTWAFKQLAGITYDNLSDEESSAIRAKRGSTYESGGGISITFEGATPAGEFLDLVVSTDFLNARIAEDVYAFLAKAKIVLFNQKGIDATLGVAQNRLNKSTKNPNPILSTDVDAEGVSLAPSVVPILVSEVDAADKTTRRLTGITWFGKFNGAIHGGDISGTIGV